MYVSIGRVEVPFTRAHWEARYLADPSIPAERKRGFRSAWLGSEALVAPSGQGDDQHPRELVPDELLEPPVRRRALDSAGHGGAVLEQEL